MGFFVSMCFFSYVMAVNKYYSCFHADKNPTFHKLSLLPPLPPIVAPELDIEAFQGRWYQYSSGNVGCKLQKLFRKCGSVERKRLAPRLSFFRKSNRITPAADSIVSDIGDPSVLRMVTGFKLLRVPVAQKSSAIVVRTEAAGKFEVISNRQSANQYYWVVAVGPKLEGKYQYSIVATSDWSQVHVLVRDIENYLITYKKKVDAKLKKLNLSALAKRLKPNRKISNTNGTLSKQNEDVPAPKRFVPKSI